MDGAFREMGLSDTAVPKRMKTLYSSFAGRMTAYRQAIGDRRALVEAVARNVFPEEAADERAEMLAAYLTDATAAVVAADISELRRGNIPFPPLVSARRAGRRHERTVLGLLPVHQIPANGKHIRVEADEGQRRAIAEALEIVSVEALTAELDVGPIGADAISVRGALTARWCKRMS